MIKTQFFDIGTNGSSAGWPVSIKTTDTIASSATIQTICSMDFYGLFLGIKDATKVVRLEIDIKNNDGDPPAITYVSNVMSVNSINYYEMDATATYRLLQT